MPDPGFEVRCPYCGAVLIYQRTDGDTHVFQCQRHGAIILPPDGIVRQQPA
jgi:hypothetical protein